MELDVCDRITADPTREDITRAIDQRGDDPDWFITLSDDDGYVEAELEGKGRFRLAYHSGKARFDAAETVDAATLKVSSLAKRLLDVSRGDGEQVAPPSPDAIAVAKRVAAIFGVQEVAKPAPPPPKKKEPKPAEPEVIVDPFAPREPKPE